MNFLWIGVFGALGCVLRYGVATLFPSDSATHWPTLLVNLIGAFAIGYLSVKLDQAVQFSPALRLGLTTGLLGGFTTFSTFSLESLKFIQGGQISHAVAYALCSLSMGIVFVFLGVRLAGA